MKFIRNILFAFLLNFPAYSQITASTNDIVSWTPPTQYVDGTPIQIPINYSVCLYYQNTLVGRFYTFNNYMKIGNLYNNFITGQIYTIVLQSITDHTYSTAISQDFQNSNSTNYIPTLVISNACNIIFTTNVDIKISVTPRANSN